MKKHLFIFILTGLFFSACKKQNDTKVSPAGKSYTVHFNVSGFSQSTVPFNTNLKTQAASGDSLKNSVSVLYYLVYRNAVRIRKITQQSTDANFGSITDSFSSDGATPPTYRVVVVAGASGLRDADTIDPNASSDQFQYFNNGNLTYFSDTFYKSISFQAPDSTYNLALDRIVAQLKVNILDAIPVNAKRIDITFSDYQAMSAATGLANTNFPPLRRTISTNVNAGTTGTTLSAILLNTKDTFIVEIKAYDANNIVIASKSVGGVSCKANAITLLSGNLFGTAGTSFNISYNPVWDAPNQVSF